MKTPFSTEQFISVFEKYNSALYPAQFIILVLGIIAIIFLHSNNTFKNFYISGFLGLLWLWIGVVYHFYFFAEINKVAYIFSGLFIIQGLIFYIEAISRVQIIFEFDGKVRNYIGYFFILFGLILYPIIGYNIEHDFSKVISLGLPCPTVILTFGFLMNTNKSLPIYVLIIPTIWALIGFTAVLNFGIYQDIMLLVSAIVAGIWLLMRKKNLLINNS